MELRSFNPAFKNFTRRIIWDQSETETESEPMTIKGTINKSAILLLTIIVTASFMWRILFSSNNIPLTVIAGLIIGGGICGLIVSIVTIFKQAWSKVTAPIYAVCEGLFLGGVSAFFENILPGLVINAIILTFGVFGIILLSYRTGIIKPTKKFIAMVVSATGAVALVYLVDIVLGMFGIQMPMIHENGKAGIILSAIVVVLAALNLVVDFKNIEDSAEKNAPAYMEWYLAFGLMVTLVWLYLELLQLLAKLRNRD